VPEAVEDAVSKALAKLPADRFASAAEFADALTAVRPAPARPRRSVVARTGLAAAGLAAAALVAFALLRARGPVAGLPIKMTRSGNVTAAALAPDGTRLAKSVRECDADGRCSFALVWQDLGGAGELRLAKRLGSVSSVEWSPDARQLVFQGSDSIGRYGAFKVGALGGPLQFLGCCAIHFLTTADTVLLIRNTATSGLSLRVITPADGEVHDSADLQHRAPLYFGPPSPDGKLVTEVMDGIDSSWLVTLDRRWGRVDSIALPREYAGEVAWDPHGDAMYVRIPIAEGIARLERVPVDGRGRLGARKPMGRLTLSDRQPFSIVDRDRTLLYLEGGTETMVEALAGHFPESGKFTSRELRRSTASLSATLSPDGRFVVMAAAPAASPRVELTILPFDGGAEIPVSDGVELVEIGWAWNSSRLFYTSRAAETGVTLHSFDPVTGRGRVIGPGPRRGGWEPVPGGLLAWVDDSAGAIVLADTTGHEVRRLADPDRGERSGFVRASPDGASLLSNRWSSGFDSMLFTRIDPKDGHRQRLGGLPAEGLPGLFWDREGSIQIAVLETLGTLVFYRLNTRGRAPIRLASYPVEGPLYLTFSNDGRRAVKVESRPRGDVWVLRNFDGRRRAE
jgi:dipeptidyl aminopeptidase/acylaminoacyl peptidase